MLRTLSVLLALLFIGSLLVLASPPPVLADDDEDNDRLRAVPFAFVGTDENCGVAGSNIVTAAWLGGMGLPDNGGQNTTAADVTTNPNKQDPHFGLLLSKNGPTADCSAPGAEITGVKGIAVTADFYLGFDYRNGTHCGAGAGRFNVSYRKPDGTNGFSFVGGCSNDHQPMGAPQDPAQWTRVRFETSDPLESFPPIPVESRIKSISVILDEGTDTATNDTEGVGLAVVDNIDINGRIIRRGNGIATGTNRDGDNDDD